MMAAPVLTTLPCGDRSRPVRRWLRSCTRGSRGCGLIHGWCESDSCLARDPSVWNKPYFANSAFAVRGWRDRTIIPIRDVRRKLKGAPTLVDAGKQEALRTKIKAVELEAERLQQEALYAKSRSAPISTTAPPPAAARANLAGYERMLGTRFAQAAIDRLVSAFETLKFADFAAP